MQIDASLAGRLVAAQFPHWAHLPIKAVESDGWDNRTFRLGEEMSLRLPSAERYSAQVEKEQRWLPELAPHLPFPVPEPVAMGIPSHGYPWKWSVFRWIEGESADRARVEDPCAIAACLARFLHALQQVDSSAGPPPGEHNFFRGGPLSTYDAETRRAIAALRGDIDADAVAAIWRTSLAAPWLGPPVWLHGDVSAGNLLLRDGRLCAVIDFGCCGVGDPSCDLAIAWTLFSGESREAFRAGLPLDDAAWERGRGWALWKSLTTLAARNGAIQQDTERATRVLTELLADHPAAF